MYHDDIMQVNTCISTAPAGKGSPNRASCPC